MRRIVIIVAVVLSVVPLAVRAVPAALAAARGTGTTDVALVPSAPPNPALTGTASPAPSTTPTSKTPTSTPPAKKEEARASQRLRVQSAPRKVVSSGSCQASYYGEGQQTASGESFNPGALTAAHRTLPFGSRVRVVNKNNNESVVVRINDRGPFIGGRCLDLSTAAMRAVGGVGSGVIPVRYEVLAA